MAQAKICWDMGEYEKVERLFQKSAEFCNDNEVWKLNVAHTLFMQGNKYKEAASFYEPLIRTHYGNVSFLLPQQPFDSNALVLNFLFDFCRFYQLVQLLSQIYVFVI